MIAGGRHLVAGFSCLVCGANVDVAAPCSWRCPNATDVDRHHALAIVERGAAEVVGELEIGQSTFARHRRALAWDAFAAANGMTDAARAAMVGGLDAALVASTGATLHVTPFGRSAGLSEALGFSARGGVWVKVETDQLAGSHKARHLATILLHLMTLEAVRIQPWPSAARPALAIASCGNAALAAATLAAAVSWPIEVFVPSSADLHVTKRLGELGAMVVVCPRRESDPPGDPCVHRFREAVGAGRIPFTVQGTENVWCLDGGRTIGWEIADQLDVELDRIFVQVGGGALAACLADGLTARGERPRFHAVQTQACAPLARAWASVEGVGDPASSWTTAMWPWESVGASAADGILDDETYDWLPVVAAMADSGGGPVVASEEQVLEAHALVTHTADGQGSASATGGAGLAGLLAIRGEIGDDERVAIVLSGAQPPAPAIGAGGSLPT